MSTHNLPSQPATFVGRQAELAELGRLLADPTCRLLTLTGPGGIGKTRLAVEAAAAHRAQFADGVGYIALQPLVAAEYMVAAIAEVLQVTFSGQGPARDQLLAYLREKEMLLLLDNFEHLLAGVDLLPAILAASPGVKLLVTSREMLGLQEEWIRPLDGLGYPDADEAGPIEHYGAVRLFAERARRVRADFDLERERACVVRICRLVQGVPLAIELAVAWLKALPCAEVAAEIERSLDFLAGTLRDLPERHRSMRAVFEQSWQRLGDEEREVLKRLAVFHGGFRRGAAQVIAGAGVPHLQALVEKSLLRLTPAGRYSVHELLRQFALDKLDAVPAERMQAQDRHAVYYARLVGMLERHLRGPEAQPALAEIDAEIDNVRAAWQWACRHARQAEIREAMGGLFLYYQARTRLEEPLDAFERACEALIESGDLLLSELQAHTAWFTASVFRPERAAELYGRAIAGLRQRDVQPSTLMALGGVTFVGYLPSLPWTRAEIEVLYRDNLARGRPAGDRWAVAWSLYGLGALAYSAEDWESAEQLLGESLAEFRAGGLTWVSTWPLNHLAVLLAERQRYAESHAAYSEALAICRELGDRGGVTFALGGLGTIAAKQREFAVSQGYWLQAMHSAYDSGRMIDVCWQIAGLAETLAEAGNVVRAVELLAFVGHYVAAPWNQKYMDQQILGLAAAVPAETVAAARRRGETYRLPVLLSELDEEFRQEPRPQHAAANEGRALAEPLTPRELEVLALVADGLSNREIASRLVVTVGAVKKHLNNVFGKLEVQSRTQAIARARALQLLQD